MLSPRTLVLSALAAASIACGGAADAPTNTPELRSVKTPAGFTFATQRAVTVGVKADDAVFGDKKDVAIEMSEPNGDTVFVGALRKGKTLDVSLPVGVHLDSLNARVTGAGNTKFYNFPIDEQTHAINAEIR